MRHKLLYGGRLVVSSSKPLHQRNQLEQIFEAKETSAARHCYEWIFRHDRGPTRRNRVQLSRAVVEVHPHPLPSERSAPPTLRCSCCTRANREARSRRLRRTEPSSPRL